MREARKIQLEVLGWMYLMIPFAFEGGFDTAIRSASGETRSTWKASKQKRACMVYQLEYCHLPFS
jgi:hypothetical protein